MTSFLSVRKRAEEFADVIDAVMALGTSAAVPRPHAAGDPLLDLVLALRAVPAGPAVPRPEFTLALRERLLAEAASVLAPGPSSSPDPTRRPGPRRTRAQGRRVAVAATALVAVGGTAGVATAAQNSLPGDTLYPVKRALEGAQFKLSTSDRGRAHDLLDQASHRLDEVDELLKTSSGSPAPGDRLPGTIDAFVDQAQAGSLLLLLVFQEEQDPADVVAVRKFARSSMKSLSTLAGSAPDYLIDDLFDAARAMRDLDRTALGACPECEGRALRIPRGFGRDIAATDASDLSGAPLSGVGITPLDLLTGGGSFGGPGTPARQLGPVPVDQPGPSEALPSVGPTAGTPDPTDGPTDPTEVPTDPTEVPSQDPTDGPTEVPTDQPTDGPTDGPTEVPTEVPTDPPSPDPTDGPTDHPTDSPSSDPTDAPTGVSTDDPDGGGGKATTGPSDDPDPGDGDGDGGGDGDGDGDGDGGDDDGGHGHGPGVSQLGSQGL